MGRPHIKRLLVAAEKGHLRRVERYLAEVVGDVETLTAALGWAVSSRNLDVIRTLLNAGADPTLHATGLRTAVENGDMEIVRLLLARGAPVNMPWNEPFTPLRAAIDHGHEEIAILLIDRGASVDVLDWYGRTMYQLAVHRGRGRVAKYIRSKRLHR